MDEKIREEADIRLANQKNNAVVRVHNAFTWAQNKVQYAIFEDG